MKRGGSLLGIPHQTSNQSKNFIVRVMDNLIRGFEGARVLMARSSRGSSCANFPLSRSCSRNILRRFRGKKVQSPSTSSLSLSRRTDVSQGILDGEIYRNKGKLSNNIIFGGFRADRLPSERVWLQLTVFFSVCKIVRFNFNSRWNVDWCAPIRAWIHPS